MMGVGTGAASLAAAAAAAAADDDAAPAAGGRTGPPRVGAQESGECSRTPYESRNEVSGWPLDSQRW
eukprot:5830756-Prymnesium_polylepis.2